MFAHPFVRQIFTGQLLQGYGDKSKPTNKIQWKSPDLMGFKFYSWKTKLYLAFITKWN